MTFRRKSAGAAILNQGLSETASKSSRSRGSANSSASERMPFNARPITLWARSFVLRRAHVPKMHDRAHRLQRVSKYQTRERVAGRASPGPRSRSR